MDSFFRKWPNTKFVGKFIVCQPGSSDNLKSYYYYKIIPDVRDKLRENGDWKTEKETEEFCRSLCPILWDEIPDFITGKYDTRLREINELDNQEFVFYIEYLRQFAAENLYLYIEDPRVI